MSERYVGITEILKAFWNKIKTKLGGSVSIGTIVMSGTDLSNEGFLLCDGREVLRSSYTELFQKIGTKFGEGDGTTTFNIPDYVSRFPEGTATESEVGEKVNAGLPDITGGYWNVGGKTTTEYKGCFEGTSLTNNYGTTSGSAISGGSLKFNASKGEKKLDGTLKNDVYGKSDTVQPASQKTYYFIKAINAEVQSAEENPLLDDSKVTPATVWSSAKVNAFVNTLIIKGRSVATDTVVLSGSLQGLKSYYNGLTVKVLFTSEVQSAVQINAVRLSINGLGSVIINAPAYNSYPAIRSHQLVKGSFSSDFPHRWCDSFVTLEMVYYNNIFIVIGNPVMVNYRDEGTVAEKTIYNIYANGLIEIKERFTGSGTTATRTLPVVFSDKNYTVIQGDGVKGNDGTDTEGYNYCTGCEVRTTTTIKFSCPAGRSISYIATGN